MHHIVGLDSVVGIPTSYRLDSLGIILVEAGFSTPDWTAPGAHPASYTASTMLFLDVKQLECDVNHPPPSSAEVKERVELFLCSPSVPLWHVIG
jgi:hypothetical protein